MSNQFTLLIILFLFGCNSNSSVLLEGDIKVSTLNTSDFIKLKNKFNKVFGEYKFNIDSTNIDCAYMSIEENNISICAFNSLDVNSVKEHKAIISISNDSDYYIDTIDQQNTVFVSSLNLSVDIYKNYVFIGWVSGNSSESTPASINIKCFNLLTKQKEFETNVYQQRWGIERLSIKYNPFTKSVLFAYNDFNKSDSKYLYLGSLSFNELKSMKAKLSPSSIINQDNSEKRYPKFIRSDKAVYLYHTSGDTWGMLSHRGHQGFGISRIDEINMPKSYQTFSDKNKINEEILLINDSIYYQHVIGRNNGDFEIKKFSKSDFMKK